MNGSILQTALTNKRLRLELDYRKPSMPWEDNAGAARPTTDIGVVFHHTEPKPADEFACLLSVI